MAEDLLKGGKRRKGTIGSFPVPSDFSPEGKRFAQFVNDSLQQLRGEKGNKLDSAVTFGDLINSGLAEKSNIQVAGGGSTISAAGGGVVNILKSVSEEGVDFPTAPSGVSADGAFKNIIIDWDYPTYQGHSHTEVFVADANSFASVEITKGRLSPKFLGQTTATVFNHAVGNNQTKFYWVRHINKNGVAGPVHSTTGVTATTVGIDTVDFEDLAVTNAKLANLAVDEAKIANLAVTGAKIANATIDSAKIGDGEITNAKIGTLNADKIIANTLNVGGKAISGTMGKVGFNQTTQNSSPSNLTFDLTNFFGGNPLTSGSTTQTNLVNFALSFPVHAGGFSKNYIAVCTFKPVGTFPSNAEIISTFSVSSSSAHATNPSSFQQFVSTGTLAGTQTTLTLLLSIPSNSTRYFRVHGNFRNCTTNASGQLGFGTISIHVNGLSA